MMKDVDLSDLGFILEISTEKMLDIQSRYPPDDDKEAMISHAVRYNSHITWKQLSDNLQKRGYIDIATSIVQKYGKGQ